MTDEQWKALVEMWSSPKHKEKRLKAKVSRGKVKYPHKTGSRCYIAQTYVVKDKYKEVPPTAIDLFRAARQVSVSPSKKPLNECKLSSLNLQKKGKIRRLPLKLLHMSWHHQSFFRTSVSRQLSRRRVPHPPSEQGYKNLRQRFKQKRQTLQH